MIIEITVGALLLAIWTVTLFFEKTIGLSMIFFALPLTFLIIYFLGKNNKIKNNKAKLFLIPIFLLSFTYGIFNNAFFNILNIVIIPVLIIIMVVGLFSKNIINLKLARKNF